MREVIGRGRSVHIVGEAETQKHGLGLGRSRRPARAIREGHSEREIVHADVVTSGVDGLVLELVGRAAEASASGQFQRKAQGRRTSWSWLIAQSSDCVNLAFLLLERSLYGPPRAILNDWAQVGNWIARERCKIGWYRESGVIAASGGWICGASAVVCVVVSVDLDSDHDDEVKMNGSGVDPLVVYIQIVTSGNILAGSGGWTGGTISIVHNHHQLLRYVARTWNGGSGGSGCSLVLACKELSDKLPGTVCD